MTLPHDFVLCGLLCDYVVQPAGSLHNGSHGLQTKTVCLSNPPAARWQLSSLLQVAKAAVMATQSQWMVWFCAALLIKVCWVWILLWLCHHVTWPILISCAVSMYAAVIATCLIIFEQFWIKFVSMNHLFMTLWYSKTRLLCFPQLQASVDPYDYSVHFNANLDPDADLTFVCILCDNLNQWLSKIFTHAFL